MRASVQLVVYALIGLVTSPAALAVPVRSLSGGTYGRDSQGIGVAPDKQGVVGLAAPDGQGFGSAPHDILLHLPSRDLASDPRNAAGLSGGSIVPHDLLLPLGNRDSASDVRDVRHLSLSGSSVVPGDLLLPLGGPRNLVSDARRAIFDPNNSDNCNSKRCVREDVA